MITSAVITITLDDGTIREYECDPDDVILLEDDVVQACSWRPPALRPRYTPGAEVRSKQAPSQVYTVVDGVEFTVPGSDKPMIRLFRSSGRAFTVAVADLYPNVTRKSK